MQKISYSQLKKDISEEKFHNIYFFQGEEYIIEYFEKMLKEKILKKHDNDFDLIAFNSENLNLAKLYAAMENFPFMATKKCILIHNLPIETWNDEQIQEFINIISDVPDFVCLIVCQHIAPTGAKNIAKLKKIQKAMPVGAICANFSKKDISIEKQLVFWAKKDYGKELSLECARKINDLCFDHSINSLKNELRKICEFESSNQITEDSLDNLIASKLKPSVFDLPKAIFARNHNKVFKMLDDLLNCGEEPIAILAVIAGEYIDLYRVKTYLTAGKSLTDLSQDYDYSKKEFRLKNAAKISSNMDISKIKLCLKFILEADEKLKSSSASPKLALSQLIAKLIIYG